MKNSMVHTTVNRRNKQMRNSMDTTSKESISTIAKCQPAQQSLEALYMRGREEKSDSTNKTLNQANALR